MSKHVLKAIPIPETVARIRDACSYMDAIKRIPEIRTQLMQMAVAFVIEGDMGTRNERLRLASDLSGIPLNLIDIASEK